METKELGKTGVHLPVIGMGTWHMGGGYTPDYGEDEKAIDIKHLEENAGAEGWRMDSQDYEIIDRAFH